MRFVQHLHEPAPVMSYWFSPPLRLRGVATVQAPVPDDAEKTITGLTPFQAAAVSVTTVSARWNHALWMPCACTDLVALGAAYAS
ncbi:MAG: hypothetical protein JO281_20985 [Pseudonocardiales bacterium]|nr:hypothetical protein [Pseudonocardiales bacterium]